MTSAVAIKPANPIAIPFDQEVADMLVRARSALYIEHPLYGILCLRLTMIEDRTIPTLCVTSKNIFYNPDYVRNELDSAERMTAVAHEVEHITLDHLNRRCGRNPKKWNAAADYIINARLKNNGFKLHKNWLYNPAWSDETHTADHIYTLLPDSDDGTDGDGRPEGGWGAQDDMKGTTSQEELDNERLDWVLAFSTAAKIAESQGKLPASMKRELDKLMGNKVDWRQKLRNFAIEVSDADYSWSHPDRRMLAYGLVLPSLYSEAMGMMVDIIDTSGSISKYILDAFGAEIIAIRDAVSPQKMINIYCDAEVAHVDEFDEFEPLTFEAHGGGGTDFRPPFAWIEDKGYRPACAIYLTDGYGPFPEAPPPYPVLWVMTTDVVPPWGEFVKIDI